MEIAPRICDAARNLAGRAFDGTLATDEWSDHGHLRHPLVHTGGVDARGIF